MKNNEQKLVVSILGQQYLEMLQQKLFNRPYIVRALLESVLLVDHRLDRSYHQLASRTVIANHMTPA